MVDAWKQERVQAGRIKFIHRRHHVIVARRDLPEHREQQGQHDHEKDERQGGEPLEEGERERLLSFGKRRVNKEERGKQRHIHGVIPRGKGIDGEKQRGERRVAVRRFAQRFDEKERAERKPLNRGQTQVIHVIGAAAPEDENQAGNRASRRAAGQIAQQQHAAESADDKGGKIEDVVNFFAGEKVLQRHGNERVENGKIVKREADAARIKQIIRLQRIHAQIEQSGFHPPHIPQVNVAVAADAEHRCREIFDDRKRPEQRQREESRERGQYRAQARRGRLRRSERGRVWPEQPFPQFGKPQNTAESAQYGAVFEKASRQNAPDNQGNPQKNERIAQ